MKIPTLIWLACLSLTMSLANAGEHGSADDAVAMVKKTVAFMNKNGRDKTFTLINGKDGYFRDRDLYVFVTDLNGRQLANGSQPRLIGKDLTELRDANGKYFVKELVELAKTNGKGWVDYRWPNPATETIDSKSTYLERVGDILIACGIYK